MKVMVLYEYPPTPAGLSTQGDLLYRGLKELGVDTIPVNLGSDLEKEWVYRWFKPDIVVGIGYWGHIPQIVLHPQSHGFLAVPWLVADGFVANYQDVLNALPLILVTSNWVKDVFSRDGISTEHMAVLPVGCETDLFIPRPRNDSMVQSIRATLGVHENELLILTVGGDAASKGAREVMQALAKIQDDLPPWQYVCKVWAQPRTTKQTSYDLELAKDLGLQDHIHFNSNIVSRNLMPYIMNACDIYAAPSRLEGFGMPMVEANSAGKPVVSILAMGILDTMIDGETAFLARVDVENWIYKTRVGPEAGFEENHLVVFNSPKVVDYRASIHDIADAILRLAIDPLLRSQMGEAGRSRVIENYNYLVVAQKFIDLITTNLGIK